MRVVKVPLGERSYSILIGRDLLRRLGVECKKLKLGRRCAVITDRNVAPLYARKTLASLQDAGFDPALITVSSGERAKCQATLLSCYNQLADLQLERKSFVIALGGGVVGDLAGFAAATYLRGIAYVQVPTTLLAQVDSSVGGKVGVNLKAGKNLVGAFHQPRLVLCDLDTLRTLSPRELSAGMAEVIKYGVIRDAAFFRQLEREMPRLLHLEPKPLAAVIARCCQIKAAVVAEDEREGGFRQILNFGHTIGHALEAVSGYGRLLHGEAIAMGMVAAAVLSSELLGLPEGEVSRLGDLLLSAGLPARMHLTPAQRERLLAAMKHDKKVSDGELKFVLAERIGKVCYGRKVPLDLLLEVLGRPD